MLVSSVLRAAKRGSLGGGSPFGLSLTGAGLGGGGATATGAAGWLLGSGARALAPAAGGRRGLPGTCFGGGSLVWAAGFSPGGAALAPPAHPVATAMASTTRVAKWR